MQRLGLNEIRQRFLSFFESKGHLVMPSFSLIPEKDKSLLIINSGMAPLKPFFTGAETPPSLRVATCQKCVRTPDIDRVGKTARHGTFFEMLGNFSFGDYFKKEAIEWAWSFVTDDLKLPIDRLWVSIYRDDDEAFDIWNGYIGLPPERIVRMGKEDNFWEIGVGPCGPCSELYFDRGEDKGCQNENCKVGCDCDRFVEFWNLVFTQYNRDEQGEYNRLPKPNIDTGMGLERIAAIMQGVDSLFDVDTIKNVIKSINRLSGKEYGLSDKSDVSMRVIADHGRGMVFMIADGILPSNEGRGYVLRRIIRRASQHGKKIDILKPFLEEIALSVINESGDAYPELKERKEFILKVIRTEENKFKETIEQGNVILQNQIEDLIKNGKTKFDAEEAFKLYDTYGFPFELTKEILGEYKISVDEAAFSVCLEEQRAKARAAQAKTDFSGHNENNLIIDNSVKTVFQGYDNLNTVSKISAIIKENQIVEEALQGDEVEIILDITPFYAEAGGQAGDIGELTADNLIVNIRDTKKLYGDKIIHFGQVLNGVLRTNIVVKAQVDTDTRRATARNHTATHLLHSALKSVLGEYVEQAGSFVNSERLRFDFRHFEALTPKEKNVIERIVNEKIMECLNVENKEMSLNEAKEIKATALFGEKYSDVVRVLNISNYSIELCGGTHLQNTGQAGLFRIVSEYGVAAGIRRIEATTGWNSYQTVLMTENKISDIASILKTNPVDLEKRVVVLQQQLKELEKEKNHLKELMMLNVVNVLQEKVRNIGDIGYIVERVDGYDNAELRVLNDKLRDKVPSLVILLASVFDGKVNIVGSSSKENVSRGIHAGKLVGEIAKLADGGGGGRPDMAQAGAKGVSKIDFALKQVNSMLEKQLNIH